MVLLNAGDAGIDHYERSQRDATQHDILRQAKFSEMVHRQQSVVQGEEALAMKIEKSEETGKVILYLCM